MRSAVRAVTFALALLATVVPWRPTSGAAEVPDDQVKTSLFAPADSARAAADAVNAAIFSPLAYQEGAAKYAQAIERFDDGGKLERIGADVADAAELFGAAARSAPETNRLLSRAAIARGDAERARAQSYATQAWEKAETALYKAASRAERGDAEDATRAAADVEALFRTAELAAIKTDHLRSAEKLLAEAKDAKAERLAPKTFAKASEALARADKLLNTNRYDTDPARRSAELAEHEAQHAIYIAGEARRTGADGLEDTLLAWEEPLLELAALLDVPITFADGPVGARVALVSQLGTLLEERKQLTVELNANREHLLALEQEVARVNTEVGGELAKRNRELDRQARTRDRLAQVEKMFNLTEAQVLRRGNQVILRLTGLSFGPGSATIPPNQYALLGKVQQAIALFPLSHISVEGHTDAVGSTQQNQDLSKRRADAVMAWVLANMPLSPANIQALGYGETRAVASNDSEQGRAQNRRIDIVIDDTE